MTRLHHSERLLCRIIEPPCQHVALLHACMHASPRRARPADPQMTQEAADDLAHHGICECIASFRVLEKGTRDSLPSLDCVPAQLVSALNNEDQGTMNFGYGLQMLPGELFNAAMGYQDISTNETRSNVPPPGTGSNYGPKECLARCAALNATATTQACGPPSPLPQSSSLSEYASLPPSSTASKSAYY